MSVLAAADRPATVWDRLSRHYRRQLWLERSAVSTALDLLGPRAAERLLDVGTGTGEVLHQLASRSERPTDAVGVDASSGMLDQVGRLPDGWSTRVADARALPFGDEEFDAAIVAYVLHVLEPEGVESALQQLRRVLRTGGRLVTVTPTVPARGPARPIARALDALGRRGPERFVGLRALDPTAALEGAGFAIRERRANLRGYPSLCVLAEATA